MMIWHFVEYHVFVAIEYLASIGCTFNFFSFIRQYSPIFAKFLGDWLMCNLTRAFKFIEDSFATPDWYEKQYHCQIFPN